MENNERPVGRLDEDAGALYSAGDGWRLGRGRADEGGGEIFAIGMVASITHGEKNTERKKRWMAE